VQDAFCACLADLAILRNFHLFAFVGVITNKTGVINCPVSRTAFSQVVVNPNLNQSLRNSPGFNNNSSSAGQQPSKKLKEF